MRHAKPSSRNDREFRTLSEISPDDPTGPRFLVEDIYPRVDGGRYPVKRIAGEPVDVWADVLREGHDVLAAELLWRKETDEQWQREPMALHSNDRWHGAFTPPAPGRYLFAIETWTDRFGTWRKEFCSSATPARISRLSSSEGRELLDELKPLRCTKPPISASALGPSSTAPATRTFC